MSSISYRSVLSSLFSGGGSSFLTNLVAYWNFDGDGVDEISSFTPISNQQINYSGTGITNLCLQSTNTTPRVNFSDNIDFSFTNGINDLPFSISFWSYATSLQTTGNWLVNKRANSTTNEEWQIIILGTSFGADSGKLGFYIYDGVNGSRFLAIKSTNQAYVLNTWVHITVTYDGSATVSGLKIYLNGALETGISISSNPYVKMIDGNSQLGLLNRSWATPSNTFAHQGRLDELAIWKNRELTSVEVTQLYNAGSGIFYPF